MAATYDSSLPTNKDWVRFLIRDTNIASAQVQDEEIAAVLSVQTGGGTTDAAKYYAAAALLEILLARWVAAGTAMVEKQVDNLRIRYAAGTEAAAAVRGFINSLRVQGAAAVAVRPRVFRVVRHLYDS